MACPVPSSPLRQAEETRTRTAWQTIDSLTLLRSATSRPIVGYGSMLPPVRHWRTWRRLPRRQPADRRQARHSLGAVRAIRRWLPPARPPPCDSSANPPRRSTASFNGPIRAALPGIGWHGMASQAPRRMPIEWNWWCKMEDEGTRMGWRMASLSDKPPPPWLPTPGTTPCFRKMSTTMAEWSRWMGCRSSIISTRTSRERCPPPSLPVALSRCIWMSPQTIRSRLVTLCW